MKSKREVGFGFSFFILLILIIVVGALVILLIVLKVIKIVKQSGCFCCFIAYLVDIFAEFTKSVQHNRKQPTDYNSADKAYKQPN